MSSSLSSSLSSLGLPTGYDGRSSIAPVSKRALFCAKQGESSRWHVQAATREEASDSVKAPPTDSSKPRQPQSEPLLQRGAAKGFGPRPSPPPAPKSSKPSLSKDKKSVTSRRPAPTKPLVLPTADPVIRQQDNVFIVGLTVLGALIFIEGISLAASGLLPQEWDDLIANYVYPAFTPTVGLFIVGAILYGVFKLRQGGGNELDEPN